MTYNFDVDGWYEREKAAIDLQLQRGQLSEEQHAAAEQELGRRYDEMLEALNGTSEYG